MKAPAVRLAVLVLLGSLVCPSRLLAEQTDLSWVARLPGLSGGVQTEGRDGTKVVYSLAGDPAAALDALRRGLEERGWSVEQDEGVTVAGMAFAGTLEASKGGASLEVTSTGTPAGSGGRTLVLQLRGGKTAKPAASAAAPAPATRVEARPEASAKAALPPQGAAPAAAPAGGVVSVYESRVTRTIDCRDTVVAVYGNGCELTLTGSCRSLAVNGNGNRVSVKGTVRSIQANGNDNDVAWTPSGESRQPSISNPGSRNKVHPLEGGS